MRRATLLLIPILLLAAGCGGGTSKDAASDDTTTTTAATPTSGFEYGTGPCAPATPPNPKPKTFAAAPQKCIRDGVDYGAVVATSEGTFTVDLLEQQAPGTVNNFVTLARWGFYDGDDFHRVIKGFMSQAGDPYGQPQGTGGPGYEIPDELPKSASEYVKGVMAMANTGQPGTGGSQWFVCWSCQLPPSYAIFGQVTAGMDVIDRLDSLGTTGDGPPTKPIAITKVTITEK